MLGSPRTRLLLLNISCFSASGTTRTSSLATAFLQNESLSSVVSPSSPVLNLRCCLPVVWSRVVIREIGAPNSFERNDVTDWRNTFWGRWCSVLDEWCRGRFLFVFSPVSPISFLPFLSLCLFQVSAATQGSAEQSRAEPGTPKGARAHARRCAAHSLYCYLLSLPASRHVPPRAHDWDYLPVLILSTPRYYSPCGQASPGDCQQPPQ